jgi:hypothetical protein
LTFHALAPLVGGRIVKTEKNRTQFEFQDEEFFALGGKFLEGGRVRTDTGLLDLDLFNVGMRFSTCFGRLLPTLLCWLAGILMDVVWQQGSGEHTRCSGLVSGWGWEPLSLQSGEKKIVKKKLESH